MRLNSWIFLNLAAALIAFLPAYQVFAESRVVAAGDILRVELEGSYGGVVVVYLPTELHPGDSVLGRMEIEWGNSGEQPADWSVALGDTIAPVKTGLAEFPIPADASDAVLIRALDAAGETLAQTKVPLALDNSRPREDIIPGRSGSGLRWLPAVFTPAERDRALQSLDPSARVIAASPRGVAVLDTLIARGGPVGGATCCSENTENCGLTSCCVDIPSNSCAFCNSGDWEICIVVPD